MIEQHTVTIGIRKGAYLADFDMPTKVARVVS